MTDRQIINKIKNIRVKNNTKWMELLQIAFKYCPKKARKIMGDITNNDMKVSKLSRELSGE